MEQQPDKYKNKYRIPSARWQDWDYGADAAYFVTVCTAQREHFFGEIVDGEMRLSEIGQTAHDCWTQIPAHFPFVVLDTFVIMPNHVHGIIVIDRADNDTPPSPRRDVACNVSTNHVATSQQHVATSQSFIPEKNEFMQSISPKPHSLPAIVRSFKSAVTKFANANDIPFAWQTRFHDRVIRDYDEHNRIARYIDENIANWQDDELNNNIAENGK